MSSTLRGLGAELELYEFPDYQLGDREKTRFVVMVLELEVGPFLGGSQLGQSIYQGAAGLGLREEAWWGEHDF